MSKSLVSKSKNEIILEDDLQVLKDSMFRGFNDSEVKLCVAISNELKLSPLLRQVHFVKRFDKKLNREVVTAQSGIDGLRLIADRSGNYAGSDDIIFEYEGNDRKQPIKATATVYKMVAGQRIGFTASARWSEYYPGDTMGFMWKSKPHIMIGKCAEALALRKAFPAELSSVYTDEEFDSVDAAEKKAERVQGLLEKQVSETTVNTVSEVEKKFTEAAQSLGEVELFDDFNGEFDDLNTEPKKDDLKASAYFTITVGKKFKDKKLIQFSSIDDKKELEKWARSSLDWFRKENKKMSPDWIETMDNVADYLGVDL